MGTVYYDRYYTATNQLDVRWEQVREVHTSGQIRTTHNLYGSPNVSGDIQSKAHILGYDLTITYTGALNIGDRDIIKRRLRDYWDNAEFETLVQTETGISRSGSCGVPYSSYAMELLACVSICTCCCAVYCCCRESYINKRRERYESRFDELATEDMAKAVALIVKEADNLVSQRIAAVGGNNVGAGPVYGGVVPGSSVGLQPGSVVLSPEQFQAFMLATMQRAPQIPMPQVPPRVPTMIPLEMQQEPPNKPMLQQYQMASGAALNAQSTQHRPGSPESRGAAANADPYLLRKHGP